MKENMQKDLKFMDREEWINKANKIGYAKEKIQQMLEEHDKDEKEANIIIPYEMLDLSTEIID